MSRKEIIISVTKQALLIGVVAYAVIMISVYAIPHLPLANKRTFHTMLRSQMTIDREKEFSEKADPRNHVLFLGSSVVERGVNETYLDSLFNEHHVPNYSTNSGAGGFFAKSNLIMFRAMLERGLHPKRVVYGIFLQELNSVSTIRSDFGDTDTSSIKLKKKSLWNVLRLGPEALAPMLDASTFHIYLFAFNNAFRDIQNPTFFQKLSFGVNFFERDSNYVLNLAYLQDLKNIYQLCKARGIPFAFFNTPLRPEIESTADLPYFHRLEAYQPVERFAMENNIPIWNFDKPGAFDNSDFLDTYHLTPVGAKKMTAMLSDKITIWQKGFVEQDVTFPSTNSVRDEIKDSLVRTIFHF